MHELLRRALAEGSPLIDGETVTFVWKGNSAPPLMGDFNAWGGWGRSMTRLDQIAPGVWAHRRKLERDAYIEYGFARIARGKVDYFRPLLDPLNPRSVPNSIGGRNSVLLMPQARMTALATRTPGVPVGDVSAHVIPAPFNLVGGKRRAWLYRPAGAAARKATPLLLVLDGADYLRRARLPLMLDNLIALGAIRPVSALFLDHAGPARAVEYHCSDAFIEALLRDVLPFARALAPLSKAKGAHGVLGASSGGLAALWIGMRMPEVFGRVSAQSGAFILPKRRGPVWEPVTSTLVESHVAADLRIDISCGTHDFLIDGNRAFAERLRRHGYAVTYREYHGGHNYACWQTDLERGLVELFGR